MLNAAAMTIGRAITSSSIASVEKILKLHDAILPA
jgi:hypothetical protein